MHHPHRICIIIIFPYLYFRYIKVITYACSKANHLTGFLHFQAFCLICFFNIEYFFLLRQNSLSLGLLHFLQNHPQNLLDYIDFTLAWIFPGNLLISQVLHFLQYTFSFLLIQVLTGCITWLSAIIPFEYSFPTFGFCSK